MLTAIRPSLSSLPAAAPPAPPAPSPAPAPAPDSLDFSRIDSPTKAALLPINEPALQVSLMAGVLFAVMAGASGGGAVPLITIDYASQSAGKNISASYTLDLKNEKQPLSVSGQVAGQPLSDSFQLDQVKKTAQLQGSVGSSPTALTMTADDKAQALQVKGKFGDVDADLKLSVIKGSRGDQDIRGIHEEGTLGGAAYTVDTAFDPTAVGQAKTAKMTVRGKLGSQDIQKDYTVTARQLPTGALVNFAGTGATAGIPQQVSVQLSLVG